MNKQSNSYTIIYSAALVLIVGIALSLVYQILKPRQDENIANDKKKQILAAILITPQNGENVADLYDKYIVDSYIVDSEGKRIETNLNPFDINISSEIKKTSNKRMLPVYICNIQNQSKYIVPVYGAGLWGPIWGYIALNNDGETIYGAYFAHKGETPGLGAEIEKSDFQQQFKNKSIYKNDEFKSIAVVKIGQEPSDKDYVHAISGGTITSQGVDKMLINSLEPYNKFLKNLKIK